MPQSDGKNKLKRVEFEFKGKAYKFNLNPEEYTQDEPSRSTVTQTKGGAWIDDFGAGLVQIFMKGSTGVKNGFEKFKELKQFIRDYYDNISPGDEVVDEMTFHNYTDEESWIVHLDPSGLKIFRSKSNPLMFMYEIRLVCIRPAQMPKIPASKTTFNEVYEKDYKSALDAVAGSIGSALSEVDKHVSSVFSSFVSKLQILNNGQVQVDTHSGFQPTPETRSFAPLISENEVDEMIEPKFSAHVSNLTLDYYRKFLSNTADVTHKGVIKDTFLYKVIYDIPKTLLPENITDIMRMLLLEVYSIYKAFTSDKEAFSKRISQEDIKRLEENIRWITVRLGEYDDESLYDVIEGFRELELQMSYFKRDSSLFNSGASENIRQYKNAGAGG